MQDRVEFQIELEKLINAHSIENTSGTPDFILAAYLMKCIEAYEAAVRCRDDWYDFKPFEQRSVDGPKTS